MPKNTIALEYTTVTPLRGNQVRLTAVQGYLLRSKHTGRESQSVITARVAGYEVTKMEKI